MSDTSMSDSTTGQGSQGTSTTGLSGSGSDTMQQVKSKAMDAVSRGTEAARSQAMSQAETAKDALADTGERLAQSLRSAVDGGDDSIQARLMAAAADSVSEWSDQLRGRNFQDLLRQTESFARRNPGAFVAAAALAGFALARFARASSSSGSSSYGSSQDSYGGAYGMESGATGGQSYGSYGSSGSMGGTMGSGGQSYGGSGMGGASGFGSSTRMGGMESSGMGATGDMGGSSGSGLGSGGSYAGAGSYGVGTGAGYAAGRPGVSTTGMSTHDDDGDEAGSIADDGLGGGSASGGTGSATPFSSGDSSSTDRNR
ncbi:hypothetical protein [Rubellimicrobium roseum]|uniref:Uncharacterized protein n=1 Tax=Rubellimicrobium roseum TaxID=687525 RepID=A0A5C4NGD1_9RHOB|nr:hypothetical protein [Rubellimicrobium roseum]TNC72448.1 hypothetical protein FHG71_08670 [Rubellimicrobium roseum]